MTKEERKRWKEARLASMKQARIEDDMAFLEMARKRMEHYQSEGKPVPNLVETMKYSMRRDPGAQRFYQEDGAPHPLPENIETNFVTGLGDYSVQKPNPSGRRYRTPDTTANYIRNPDLSVPVVDPTFDRKYHPRNRWDTVNIDKELVGGYNDEVKGFLKDFNLTASDKEKNPVLNFPLNPLYGKDNTGDIRMHEGMHKAYDYAFRSPFFSKMRGKFLGKPTVPADHKDEPHGKQVDYNKSIARGGSGSDKWTSREHDMIYSSTTPDERPFTPYVREDARNWEDLIGKAYGKYDKEAAASSLRHPQTHQGSGLAAMQIEAYRRGITENELFCEIFPDDPKCKIVEDQPIPGWHDTDPDIGAKKPK